MSTGRDLKPHQLVMTATPIPRTLAMTVYADLDTSVIRELPPGRQPVTTVAMRGASPGRSGGPGARSLPDRARALYWVCPLIEQSDVLDSQAVETAARAAHRGPARHRCGTRCTAGCGPTTRIAVMKAFAAGKLQVLVATTVIEVGVDVPDATLMIIENAERLGLSQLHQLRGRVGRGRESSTCVLLYGQPLARLARERLDIMRRTNDGFEVAQRDLELRGPGEVLGTRQTGMMQLRVADLIRDADLCRRCSPSRGSWSTESRQPWTGIDAALDRQRNGVRPGVSRASGGLLCLCTTGFEATSWAAPRAERQRRNWAGTAPAGHGVRSPDATGHAPSASGCCSGQPCGHCGLPAKDVRIRSCSSSSWPASW